MTYKNPNSFYDDTFKQKILNQYIFMMIHFYDDDIFMRRREEERR